MPTIEINDVESISLNPNYLIIDVRNKERYDGITEPIDLVAGHIPGPVNIPFTENLNNNGLSLKPSELKLKYEASLEKLKLKILLFIVVMA